MRAKSYWISRGGSNVEIVKERSAKQIDQDNWSNPHRYIEKTGAVYRILRNKRDVLRT